MSGSSVTINGKVINVENGKSISIIGDTIFVDGQEIDTKETDLGVYKNQTVNIIVHGDVGTIDCSGSVTVHGNVKKGIDCGGSVTITGALSGNIDAGGSVIIKGGHNYGSINSGGSVSVYR